MLPRQRAKHIRSIFQDINVTPYMNLMAALIPFLLSVAVFTRLAVLEVYLPPSSDQPEETPIEEEKKDELILTVTIAGGGLVVANGQEIVGFVPTTEAGHDFEGLSKILLDLKARFPGEKSAIILSKPEIPYGTLIGVMDVVQIDASYIPIRDLFPNVSLGEVQ